VTHFRPEARGSEPKPRVLNDFIFDGVLTFTTINSSKAQAFRFFALFPIIGNQERRTPRRIMEGLARLP
jgi:hypothetical protein